MEEPTVTYNLTIKVNNDVADIVRASKYKPVVQILEDTKAEELDPDEETQWVEVKKTANFPPLSNYNGRVTTFVQKHRLHAGKFDIKFQGPKPDTKEIWIAWRAARDSRHRISRKGLLRLHDDQENEDEYGGIDPMKITELDFERTLHIAGSGNWSQEDDEDDEYGVREKGSLCIVNDTKLRLFFWIFPKDAKDSPTFKNTYQEIEWLPGSGRIKLPATAAKALKVKVWLEAVKTAEALNTVAFYTQTRKKMVIYDEETTTATVWIDKHGFWPDYELEPEDNEDDEDGENTKGVETVTIDVVDPTTFGRTASDSPPAAKSLMTAPRPSSNRSFGKRQLPINGTMGKVAQPV